MQKVQRPGFFISETHLTCIRYKLFGFFLWSDRLRIGLTFVSKFLEKILLKLTSGWSTPRVAKCKLCSNIWLGVEGFTTLRWWRLSVIYLQCLRTVVRTWTKEAKLKHLRWKDTSVRCQQITW
jgi:hypothetical protein